MKKIFILITTFLLFIACETKAKENNLQNGDIIFQDSTSSQSKAIKLATHSKYSHMGLSTRQPKELLSMKQVQPLN